MQTNLLHPFLNFQFLQQQAALPSEDSNLPLEKIWREKQFWLVVKTAFFLHVLAKKLNAQKLCEKNLLTLCNFWFLPLLVLCHFVHCMLTALPIAKCPPCLWHIHHFVCKIKVNYCCHSHAYTMSAAICNADALLSGFYSRRPSLQIMRILFIINFVKTGWDRWWKLVKISNAYQMT